MMGKAPKRLGEFLVQKGILTQDQLVAALEAQRSSGEFLGALLVRRGWVTEEQVLAALSEQFGIPRVHLAEQQADWSVAQQFSATLLVEHGCFPLRQNAGSVTVAISNPLDVWTVSALEKEARGRRVELVLATPHEIEAKIRQFHQRTLEQMKEKEEPGGQ